jgi:hypothetical protein
VEGLVKPETPGAQLRAHTAGWARLIIGEAKADFQITDHKEHGSCGIRGVGTPRY